MKDKEKEAKAAEEKEVELTDEQLVQVTGGKEQTGGSNSETSEATFTAYIINEGAK